METPTDPRRGRRRTEDERRARRILAIALVGLFVLQHAAYTAFRWLAGGTLDALRASKVIQLRDLRRDAGARPSIVVLGSSRTEEGVQAAEAEAVLAAAHSPAPTVYNLGVSGGGPLFERLCWRDLVRGDLRPDVVVIEIFASLLGDLDGEPRESGWIDDSRIELDDFATLERFGYGRAELYGKWLVTRALPLHAFRWMIVGRWLPDLAPGERRLRPVDSRGTFAQPDWTAVPGSYERGLARAAAEHRQFLEHLELGASATRVLRELVQQVRASGTKVVLLRMPESTDFRGWYSRATTAALDQVVDVLRADDPEAIVVDASSWVPDAEFKDGHHLSRRGGLHFSDRLAREVLSPIVDGLVAAKRLDSPVPSG